MLRGAAPKLKQVVLNWCGSSPHSYRCSESPTFPLANRKAEIETLSVDAVRHLDLEYWASMVDFNKLTRLRLRGLLNHEDAIAFQEIIRKDGLSNLRLLELWRNGGIGGDSGFLVSQILAMTVAREDVDFAGFPNSATMSTATQMQCSPLKVLELKAVGGLGPNQESIQHLEEIVEIGHPCPILERIELTIKRTYGDFDELISYGALARMPRLRHVKIHLDCSERTRSPETGEPVVGQGGQGTHLSVKDYRQALINTAIDETLAHNIFHCFSSKLEYLRLKPRGHGELGRGWYDEQAMELLDWIARDWVVRRSPLGEVNASRGGCVREGPYGGGPWRGESLLRADFGRTGDFEDQPREDLRALWTSIWPGRDGDRAEQWCSVALGKSRFEC